MLRAPATKVMAAVPLRPVPPCTHSSVSSLPAPSPGPRPLSPDRCGCLFPQRPLLSAPGSEGPFCKTQLRGPRASLKSLWLPSTVTIQLGSLPGRVPSLPSHVLPSPPWSPCCGRTGTLSAPQPWRAHAHLCVCCSLRLLFAWPRVAPTCHLARSRRLPTRPAPRDAPTALRSRRSVPSQVFPPALATAGEILWPSFAHFLSSSPTCKPSERRNLVCLSLCRTPEAGDGSWGRRRR